MTKEDIIAILENLNLPKEEFYIISGGALLWHDLRDTTEDLDLCVSEELFEHLKQTRTITIEEKPNIVPIYLIDNTYEFIVKSKKDWECTEVNGYLVATLESILAFKENRNLPKDQKDIVSIRRKLKKM